MTLLVDTSVIVDHLRGRDGATRALFNAMANESLVCSRLTMIELAFGMRDHQRETMEALLQFIEVIEVDQRIGVRAEELAREWGPSHAAIDVTDFVIAATAELGRHRLLTCNVKHFPMMPDLKPPY